MSIKPKRRIETGDHPDNVEVFDLDYPRPGDDEQFRLFNYEYHSRRIPSGTPRTEECAVNLTLKFQGLAMEDSDEEHATDNYTFSPKVPTTGKKVDRPEKFPLPESCLYRGAEAKYQPGTWEGCSKIDLNSSSVDHLVPTNPASPGPVRDRSQLPQFELEYRNLENQCVQVPDRFANTNSIDSASKQAQKYPTFFDETKLGLLNLDIDSLDRVVNGEQYEDPQARLGRHLEVTETSGVEAPGRIPSSIDLRACQPVVDTSALPKSKSNGSTRIDPVHRHEELKAKTENLPTNHQKSSAKPRDQRLHLALGGDEESVKYVLGCENSTMEPRSTQDPEEKKHTPASRRAATPPEENKIVKHNEEDITTELYGLHLEPNTTTQPLILAATTLTAETKSAAETTTSLDFDLTAHSILGAGSWVEYDTHELLPLDVEGLYDVNSIGNELKAPEDQERNTTFTTCHGNSATGSTPQKDSGGSSSDSGSREPRQSPPNGGGHHKHPSDGSNGPGEDDDPIQSKKAKTDNGTHRRFVCPFYIHDPSYFTTSLEHGQKYTLCANGMGFADIARLKEHLNRVHSPEIACARCGTTFRKQQDLDMHLDLRNEGGPECPILDLPASRTMTTDMITQLSRRGKRLSEEEKWFKIYKILFPNDPKPSTRPYRHDFDQPPTPSFDKQPNIPSSESDLPRLLERRVETRLGRLVLDPDCRDQIMKMVLSELVFCMNQLSVDYMETPNTFDESHVQRHRQSAVSSIDSAYGSRSGHIDCMGNCSASAPLVPSTAQSQEYAQPLCSPAFDPMEQYLEPSVFTDPEPTEHQQWTKNLDDLRGYNLSGPYSDNPYLDDSGT
ncbi:hypothetical protein N431DRAFT_457818 [Stipitochalara longipes BDJ]|nr:hypothetical protein N431DRAFT_457818 [Stipitochalara longipes BDJ]